MRDLQKSFEECLADIQVLNITVGTITKIEWGDLKDAWGECNGQWTGNGWVYWIAISKKYLNDNISEIYLRETVYHEILHTCHRCHSHSKTWVKNALLIDKAYGCGIATFKTEYYVLHPELPEFHQMICPYCGGKLRIKEQDIWKQIRDGRKANCVWCRHEMEIEF